MAKVHRPHSNSTTAHLDAFAAAAIRIDPPKPLPVELRPLWDEILGLRSLAEWNGVNLEMAYSLTLTMAQLREQEQLLASEGVMIEGGKVPLANPRLAIVERLSTRVMTLQSRLRISAAAQGVKSADLRNTRQLERNARLVLVPDPPPKTGRYRRDASFFITKPGND